MRIILTFPPVASGTYVPIGIAALKAYINRELPATELMLSDLNILSWHWLLNEQPDGAAFFSFIKNQNHDFYNAERYLWYKTNRWDNYQVLRNQWIKLCKIYLEQGVLDADLSRLLEYLAANLIQEKPQLLGFSIMYPRQLLFSLALSKYIKTRLTDAITIILGGAALSTINCREIMTACAFIDLILTGEAEHALAGLCRGTPYPAIPGLLFREKAALRVNEKQNTFGIKQLPPADFSSLPLPLYFNPTPVFPAFFSRGCAWRKCRFCVHNYSFAGFRCKSIKQFVDELELYATRHQACHFYFTDQYIFEKGIEAIAAEILIRKLDIRFHYMGRPTGGYTEKNFALLYQAGCRWISWGIESGSQSLLDMIVKGTYVKEIKQTIKRSADAGISNLGMMIFGLPGSSEEELKKTLDFLNELAPCLDAITESEFMLFKDTPFARNPRQYKLRITGAEELCTIGGKAIHSSCLCFQEMAADGSWHAPAGSWEAAQWKKKQQWFFKPQVYHAFNAEHYLLYASIRTPSCPVS